VCGEGGCFARGASVGGGTVGSFGKRNGSRHMAHGAFRVRGAEVYCLPIRDVRCARVCPSHGELFRSCKAVVGERRGVPCFDCGTVVPCEDGGVPRVVAFGGGGDHVTRG
ncbi:MAG: hypothetical protein IIV08_01910, partial [Selenomonadales bacterium]|nr:hypothetical protein [Selenomonadales bacterium]